MAAKYVQGSWDVYTGQYFSRFDPARHVIPAAEALSRIKPWHKVWMSGDWGEAHPACFHWFAQDERGNVITFQELWGTHMGESLMGQEITRLGQPWLGDRFKHFYFSWDAFGKLSKTSGVARKPTAASVTIRRCTCN